MPKIATYIFGSPSFARNTSSSPPMDSPASSKSLSKISPLHRGEACLTCRRRKMKCDAGKPSCAPCQRAGKGDECEYEETKFQAQVQRLEDEVRSLRGRLSRYEPVSLESPPLLSPISPPPFQAYVESSSPSSAVAQSASVQYAAFMPTDARSSVQLLPTLDHASRGNSPRGASDSSDSQMSQPSPFGNSILPPFTSSPTTTGTPLSASPGGHLLQYDLQYDSSAILQPQDAQWIGGSQSQHSGPAGLVADADLSPNMVLRLVNIFLPHSRQCGLDINPSTFMSSLSHPSTRPHAALMNAIYLWACHFSQSPQYAQFEPVFFNKVVFELARGTEKREKLVNLVQAQCLLSLYLFVKGRLLEGYHHSGAAMRLAVTLGLHQIQTGTWRLDAPAPAAHNAFLPLPTSALEEQERILAWWQVFNLDRIWSTVLELPLALADSDHPRSHISTPLPGSLPADTSDASPASAPGGTPPFPAAAGGPAETVNVSLRPWSDCLAAKNVPLKSESPFPFLQGMLSAPFAHHSHSHSHAGAPAPAQVHADAAPATSLARLLHAPEHSFVAERPDALEALRAKTAALFARATSLASAHAAMPLPTPAWWAEFHAVSGALERLHAVLPPVAGAGPGDEDRLQRLAVHVLEQAAVVRLYGVFLGYGDAGAYRNKCLLAVRQAAGAAATMVDADYGLLDPFVGVCWIHLAGYAHNDMYAHGQRPGSPSYRGTVADLNVLTMAARRLSGVFPFLDIHVQQLERGAGTP